MAQETRVEETGCSLQAFERNRYFYGKPMTVSDFETEQRYFIGKHRYINRLIHGAGVLCGLQTTVPTSFDPDRPAVELGEGAALDCCGNLIVVTRNATKAEVKGVLNTEGLNYLYLKYAECSKQPVMASASVASCEEVCSYNRIQETFEVVASADPPATQDGGTMPLNAAPPSGADRAAATKAGATKAAAASSGTTNTGATSPCADLVGKYFDANLQTCVGCDDPKVFLAVLDMKTGTAVIDADATAEYRAVVSSNPMLRAMLCDHLADFNNPHRTTAEQVRALQSINGVGNVGNRPYMSEVTLSQDKGKTISITPNTTAGSIVLGLGDKAVKISNLNDEVFTSLIQSSKTVVVEPSLADRKITLRTIPATTVTSVGRTKVAGAASNYAPEDHAHDLADDVVTAGKLSKDAVTTDKILDGSVTGGKLAPDAVNRSHLSEDVYGNLLVGAGLVSVKPNAGKRNIEISVAVSPAESVSSVAGQKKVGASTRFAREDHVHDLSINGRPPNDNGQFVLSAGANIRIENGSVGNDLVISATARETPISTGLFIFEHVTPGQSLVSPPIPHSLGTDLVAVMLASEVVAGNPPRSTARFGDVTAFDAEAPFLMATLDYLQRTIQINLRDRRSLQQGGPGPLPSGDLPQPTGSIPSGEIFIPKEFDTTPTTREVESSFALRESSETFAKSETEETAAAADQPRLITLATDATATTTNERTYRIRWWAVPASLEDGGAALNLK